MIWTFCDSPRTHRTAVSHMNMFSMDEQIMLVWTLKSPVQSCGIQLSSKVETEAIGGWKQPRVLSLYLGLAFCWMEFDQTHSLMTFLANRYNYDESRRPKHACNGGSQRHRNHVNMFQIVVGQLHLIGCAEVILTRHWPHSTVAGASYFFWATRTAKYVSRNEKARSNP